MQDGGDQLHAKRVEPSVARGEEDRSERRGKGGGVCQPLAVQGAGGKLIERVHLPVESSAAPHDEQQTGQIREHHSVPLNRRYAPIGSEARLTAAPAAAIPTRPATKANGRSIAAGHDA